MFESYSKSSSNSELLFSQSQSTILLKSLTNHVTLLYFFFAFIIFKKRNKNNVYWLQSSSSNITIIHHKRNALEILIHTLTNATMLQKRIQQNNKRVSCLEKKIQNYIHSFSFYFLYEIKWKNNWNELRVVNHTVKYFIYFYWKRLKGVIKEIQWSISSFLHLNCVMN